MQVGAGQVEVAKDGSAVQTQLTNGLTANKELRAAGESGWRRQASEQVWETPEGGMESSGGEQSSEQGPTWRADLDLEDSTATETIFRSLSRKR